MYKIKLINEGSNVNTLWRPEIYDLECDSIKSAISDLRSILDVKRSTNNDKITMIKNKVTYSNVYGINAVWEIIKL